MPPHTTLLGEALYWFFLALWSFFGAYQIVVRRVQDRLARQVENFLFGGVEVSPEFVSVSHGHGHIVENLPAELEIAETPLPTVSTGGTESGEDDFIVSQLKRTK